MAGAVARISDVPVPNKSLYDPATCPAALLPWLAWAFSVDEWNPNWSETQKRGAISSSVYVHRHKGTIGAVKAALSALGVGVQLQEWFNQIPSGAPYTYQLQLEVTEAGITQAAYEQLQDVVDGTKNIRSHLDKIIPRIISRSGPVITCVASIGTEITVAYQKFSLVADGTAYADGTFVASGRR